MKRGFRVAFLIFPWLLLSALAYWLLAGHGWDDLREAVRHRRAETVFFNLDKPSATTVKIYRLSGAPEEKTGESFRVGSNDEEFPVYGTIRLKSAEIEEFNSLWKDQRVGYGGGGMCHFPPYGFRLYYEEELITETSICWKCGNIQISDAWPSDKYGASAYYAFDVSHPAAQKLLNFCDQRLPYFRPPAPEADQKPR